MTTSVSLIIPTRERAQYLRSAIQTCVENVSPSLEILILDNASTDHTATVVAEFSDSRIHYLRNDQRLSMRDNFEKGLDEARGEVVCFIGDDDAVMPNAVQTAMALFSDNRIDAVSAARAHYFWPDLVAPRRGMALLPRGKGVSTLDAKTELRTVLDDNDYYRLPCLYHGFVRRSVVDRIRRRQGRMFLSSQVDMYSAISLSMEGIKYAFSSAPLVVNGASSRSNGASHFGGGTSSEKTLWKKEDELGFLPGFEECLTVGALIVESALRYAEAAGIGSIASILPIPAVSKALHQEAMVRGHAGALAASIDRMYATASIPRPAASVTGSQAYGKMHNALRRSKQFLRSMPLDMASLGIIDIRAAAQRMHVIHESNRTGLHDHFQRQLSAVAKLARRT